MCKKARLRSELTCFNGLMLVRVRRLRRVHCVYVWAVRERQTQWVAASPSAALSDCRGGTQLAGMPVGGACVQMAGIAVLAVSIVMIVDKSGHVAYGEQVKNWGGGTRFVLYQVKFM